MTPEVRRILWSGGFDSTFLVLDALARGDAVEPYYVQQGPFGFWQKQQREREAIERVTAALPSDLRRRLRKSPIAPAVHIGEVWHDYRRLWFELRDRRGGDAWFSPQLPVLAAVADELRGVEAAFVRGDHTIADPVARVFVQEHSITFPLAGRTKRELLHAAQRGGFADLLALTWSCEAANEDALRGPCGVCDPCKARVLPQIPFAHEQGDHHARGS